MPMIAFVQRCLVLFAASFACAWALVPPPPAALPEVAHGLALPTAIADPGDGSGRLFFTEQGGLVRIVRAGEVLTAPFLDLSGRIAGGGERGLLGLAFDPRFTTNRRFFVFYTVLPDGDLRIASLLASAANPDLADPASELEVMTIPHSLAANHNGGQLAFGPDGYLYIGTGDGGGAGDPLHNGQNLGTLLGKILRVDVSGAGGYTIPADNPAYGGVPGARREIWAYGLRNPWRFSFDRDTGDLYIGDVGQNLIEEIDFMPAGTRGTNFGWPVYEGSSCFQAVTCSLPGAVPPIQEYGHVPEGGFSVTGGFVYRGAAFPELRGYYLYGDYFTTRIWATARDPAGAWTRFVLIEPPTVLSGVSSFGEDANGELYIASHGSPGHINRIARLGPPVPTPVSPMGTIASAAPTYTWTAVPGADSYYLLVQNTSEVRVSASYSAAQAGCAAGSGTCAATPALALANRTAYNWFVNASNAQGTSPWSVAAPVLFDSGSGGPPPAPSPISPAGTVASLGPTYAWSAIASAASYRLLVQNTAGVAVNRTYTPQEAGCGAGSGTCSATPPEPLANATPYNWFVNATNAGGTGPWSAATPISVAAPGGGPPAAPALAAPSGTITTASPTYSWNAVPDADSYFLLVQNTSGVAVARSLTPVAAGCGSGMGACFATPPAALAANASYAWFVSASNAAGTGPWSAGNAIFVAAGVGGPPAPPTLVSPSGLLPTTTPTYAWSAVPGAFSYFLLVQNTAGVAVAMPVTASGAGCASGAGTCSATPAAALAPGTPYAWFVNTTGSGGTGDWSAGIAIRTP